MNNYYNNCIFYNEDNNLLDSFSRNVENGSRYLIEKIYKTKYECS